MLLKCYLRLSKNIAVFEHVILRGITLGIFFEIISFSQSLDLSADRLISHQISRKCLETTAASIGIFI
jgi:hypothetical protein